ncbi:transcriptional regulator SlyA [Clostridiales bacterium CHKCI001]|nr:transcriptional regulator SlyA [Clostridiales bacterium CHKCI001]
MDKQVELMLQGIRYKQLLEREIIQIREKYSLRKVDIKILYYLSRCGEKDTSRDIQNSTKLTRGHISQSIFRMQKMNILMFIPDEKDRRCVHLKLTPEAESVVCEITEIWTRLNQIIFDGITEEEKRVLEKVAIKIDTNIEKALNEIE